MIEFHWGRKPTKRIQDHTKNSVLFVENIQQWMSNRLSGLRINANKKGIPFDLDVEYLLSVWNQQNGLCHYSNMKMLPSDGSFGWYSPSVDKKNPVLGYVKGNIVWCCFGINAFKMSLTEDDFYSLLENISWKKRKQQIIFEKVHSEAKLPTKATPGAACWDVYSIEDATVQFGKLTIVDLGFKVQIPPGYEIVIRPRSGLAFKNGITIVNAPGTIDSDYRGLMKVVLTKVHNETVKVISPMGVPIMVTDYFQIKKGDRIAQIALKKLEEYEFIDGVVDETHRGEGGFGSTGR